MKIIILIIIVCLFVTCPAHAQEIDALQSIEGTVWFYTGRPGRVSTTYLGFYEGYVYLNMRIESECFNHTAPLPSTYIDLPGIGLFWYKYSDTAPWRVGILFPLIGRGIQSCILLCLAADNILSQSQDKSLPEDFCSQVE